MTKADSKNLFGSMFVRNFFHIAVVYALALNFYMKSLLIVPWLPWGFVFGTRFSIYCSRHFFFLLMTVSNNFWSVHSLRRSATSQESSDDQSGTNGLSTKFIILFVINFCIFYYSGMSQQHRSYQPPCIRTYAEVYNAFSLGGEQL